MPPQHGIGLDDQQRLSPGAQAAGQQHQERPVGAGAARALASPLQDDQLLPKERVLEDEFGLGPRQIGQRAGDERRPRRLARGQEVATKSMRGAACGRGEPLEEVGEHGGRSEYDVASVRSKARLRSLSTTAL